MYEGGIHQPFSFWIKKGLADVVSLRPECAKVREMYYSVFPVPKHRVHVSWCPTETSPGAIGAGTLPVPPHVSHVCISSSSDKFGERVLTDKWLVCWCNGAPATKNVVKIAFERLWDFTTFGSICP